MAKNKETRIARKVEYDFITTLERLTRLMRSAEHELGVNPAQWEALRYISRANRFSNSPIALTRFLGATKGTISQTLIALEKKGLIIKRQRPGEKRSIMLELTDDGEATLADDPWQRLNTGIDALKGKQKKALGLALHELLDAELDARSLRSFGVCTSCRFFREKGAKRKSSGPHFCLLLEEDLSKKDTRKICMEHEPA